MGVFSKNDLPLNDDESVVENPNPPTHVFWRRALAYGIDFFVLASFGWIIGRLFGSLLAPHWPWSTLVGFSASLLYFGLGNSRLTGGMTLGKRMIGIKVVGISGMPVRIRRSILRACFVAFPYTLNSLLMPHFWSARPGVLFFSFLSIGVMMGDLYYYLFNRRTGQSLHDLAVITYVVTARFHDAPAQEKTSRFHHVIFLILLTGLGVALYVGVPRLVSLPPYDRLYALQTRLAAHDDILYGVASWKKVARFNEGQSVDRNYLVVTAVWEEPLSEEEVEKAANEVARIILEFNSTLEKMDMLTVTVTWGYDLGIYSEYKDARFEGSPERWRERILATPAERAE